MEREGGFSHCRPGGDGDQVIVLPSARHLVQFGQSGRDAGHSVLVFPHSPFRFHQGGLHQSVHVP